MQYNPLTPRPLTMNSERKPNILIVYTGGTIGMIENPQTHALQPFDFRHLIDNVPKIKMLDIESRTYSFNRLSTRRT